MVAIAVNSQDISAFPQKVNDATGVIKHAVLVAGTSENQVKNPAAANADKVVGVAGHAAADQVDVSVYDKGIVNLIAASAIAVGDYVNIADTTGRVKTISEAAGTANVVGIARSAAGAAGAYVKVQLQIGLRR